MGHRLDGRLGPELDVAVLTLVAVEHAKRDRLRDSRRILPALDDVTQTTGTLAVDFRLWKIRMPCDVGHQIEGGAEVLPERLHGDE